MSYVDRAGRLDCILGALARLLALALALPDAAKADRMPLLWRSHIVLDGGRT
jgi:hypothetical protein